MRSASSCGEPLNAEVVRFFREHWGVTVRDQYGSSEFGLPIGNFATVEMTVKPGSMGLPCPAARSRWWTTAAARWRRTWWGTSG